LVLHYWFIVESDLNPLSNVNVTCKFADDTDLLVTVNTDVLNDEFSQIKLCTNADSLIRNFHKTKIFVLHSLHPNKHNLP